MIGSSERRKAEFYATFASIPDIRALSAGEAVRLARQFEAASSMRLWDGFGSLTESGFEYTLEFLALHDFVRKTLEALLTSQQVVVPLNDLPDPLWRLERKRSARFVVQTWNVTEPNATPATAFVGLLFVRPFPFDRCPVCEKFFVRNGRQRYCSPTCAAGGTKEERKLFKREYMRAYMKKRRAKQRAARW
jgi:hypothetical protein